MKYSTIVRIFFYTLNKKRVKPNDKIKNGVITNNVVEWLMRVFNICWEMFHIYHKVCKIPDQVPIYTDKSDKKKIKL